MKYTTISSGTGELLENLILKYGQIVTVEQIFSEAGLAMNRQQTEYLIATLARQGWLVRIKKGLYAITDLSTRGFLSLSPYVVANLLEKDSYVSFESALHHHGMFDQLTGKIISVSLKTHKTVRLQNVQYGFIKTKAGYYFGWQETQIDNKVAYVATAEKAIADMVHFHRSLYSVDIVIEKLREHKNNLDFGRFNEYLLKMSMTTMKIFGFIFDLMNIDSSKLLKRVKNVKGAHRMIASAKIFNAKWRLYYDIHFDKYKSP
ncbi:type IV toxin-antitoxin system AbiEi family antitoxin domain-containing protein [Candidatus Peregrinibacteria bacterium]|nr:type IV toxin-antitoxin system AbiEi family antitoxin domain-containing protein [Candidatus Peregrinibacteria bacterium]